MTIFEIFSTKILNVIFNNADANKVKKNSVILIEIVSNIHFFSLEGINLLNYIFPWF